MSAIPYVPDAPELIITEGESDGEMIITNPDEDQFIVVDIDIGRKFVRWASRFNDCARYWRSLAPPRPHPSEVWVRAYLEAMKTESMDGRKRAADLAARQYREHLAETEGAGT